MSSAKRLSRALKNAYKVDFDSNSRFILFSDCHRGDNSFADDFADNRNVYLHALKYYYERDFTYFELGDGDELWENRSFATILNAHKDVYRLLQLYHEKNRLYRIYGNHDMVFQDPGFVEKTLATYFDARSGTLQPLFREPRFYEAIVLRQTDTGQQIFLAHGHQADWWNYIFWRQSRFMVRMLWKPLQFVGVADPTSPAKNYKGLKKVERRIKRWISLKNNLPVIVGHTHRPRFPNPGELPFFNAGSCVHPRSITGIEIENGQIALVKWNIDITDKGFLQIVRRVLEGPTCLEDYMG